MVPTLTEMGEVDASTDHDNTERLSLSQRAVSQRELLSLPGGSGKTSHRRYSYRLGLEGCRSLPGVGRGIGEVEEERIVKEE